MTSNPALHAGLVVVTTLLAGLATFGLVVSVEGYRSRAAVLDATFVAVAAEPGGIRLYGVSRGIDTGTNAGWNQCRAGHFEHVLLRAGDHVELDLTYHPSPRWGGCEEDAEAGSDANDLIDHGLFLPLEGPAPAIVTSGGDDHPVVDSRLGFDVHLTPAQEVSRPTLWFSDRGVSRQSIDSDGVSMILWYPSPLVGETPGAWLASGDLGEAELDMRTWRKELRIGPELRLRVAGHDLRAQLRGWSTAAATYVRVTSPDGRVLLRAEIDGATRPEVIGALQHLNLRS